MIFNDKYFDYYIYNNYNNHSNPTTVALTIAADSLTGTAGDDTFTASRNDDQTWNSGDVIDGGAGTDGSGCFRRECCSASGAFKGVENVTVTGIGAITIDFQAQPQLSLVVLRA